jgi:SAM-dependent methyltransferase
MVTVCPRCHCSTFTEQRVLWRELIDEWQLTTAEVDYIDRQQGLTCDGCGSSLRVMALTRALQVALQLPTSMTLDDALRDRPELSVLEINRAGNLTSSLEVLPGHRLVEYPEFDMLSLPFPDASFDVIVHSDTLEHVPDPVVGLAETRRLLRANGVCCFTIPLIVGRWGRSRHGLAPSYHGNPTNPADNLVHTEFGVDAWTLVVRAGFSSCTIEAFEFPAGLAITARP